MEVLACAGRGLVLAGTVGAEVLAVRAVDWWRSACMVASMATIVGRLSRGCDGLVVAMVALVVWYRTVVAFVVICRFDSALQKRW